MDNIFVQFARSFYSFKDYPRYMKSKGGRIFLYIMLMSCITYLFTFFIPVSSFFPYAFKIDQELVDEYVPYFEVKNGSFFIEEEFVYEDPDGSILLAAVPYTMEDMGLDPSFLSEYDQGFIITQDMAITKQTGSAVSIYPLDNVPDLSRDSLYQFIPWIKVAVVAIYIIVFLMYIAAYWVGTLVCSLIGLVINIFVKVPLDYDSIFKLTVFARTAPVIIKTILSFALNMNMHFVIFYALVAAYIFMGLRSAKNKDEMDEDSRPLIPEDLDAPQPNISELS